MKIFYEVYVCDDYEVGNGVLTIWNGSIIGMVSNEVAFKEFYDMYVIKTNKMPNAIICPGLFHNKNQYDIIILE